MTGGSGFIGTNFLEGALREGHETLSLDVRPPQASHHRSFWQHIDVRDKGAVTALLESWQPHGVLHLAARADTDSEVLDDYRVNVDGTAVVAEAAARAGAKRLVHASTQYVFTLGQVPSADDDYAPFTAYGQSKVMSEGVLRARDWPFSWTIIRPTNIWGPWHPRYPQEFWRVVDRGLYFHPSAPRVRRAYGYVGNVVYQVLEMFRAPETVVRGRTFYVGDEALWLDEWVDGFHVALRGRPARRIPLPLLKAAALAGDVIGRVGLKAPLTSSRLRNMTEEHVAPMARTLELFGPSPYTLADGIEQTVEWLRNESLTPGSSPG